LCISETNNRIENHLIGGEYAVGIKSQASRIMPELKRGERKGREKRKSLMARVDLADKVLEIASRRGTLYDYVNDVLEQAVRAESLGVTLKEVLDDRWVIEWARDAGFTVIPEKIVYDLTEDAYRKFGKRKMTDLWYETGQWYGKYYEDLGKFGGSVRRFFWDISEFKISGEDEHLTLTCLSSKFSEIYTELFGKFLEGALNALGYSIDEGEVSKGIISLRFVKSKGK